MHFFVAPQPAQPARSDYSRQIAVLLAGVLVVFLVAQLFTFDAFISLADTFALPGFSGAGFAVAIVVLELFALPFLLRMTVSPAFRVVSMACLAAAMLVWFYAVLVVVLARTVESVGFTGGLGTLSPGWWAIFFMSAIAILAVWSLWGLWPVFSKKVRRSTR